MNNNKILLPNGINSTGAEGNKQKNNSKNGFAKTVIENALGGVVGTVVLGALAFFFGFLSLPGEVENLQDSVNSFKDEFDSYNVDSRLSVLEARFDDFWRLEINNGRVLEPTAEFTSVIPLSYKASDADNRKISDVNKDDIIAYFPDSDESIALEDIVYKTILIPYTEVDNNTEYEVYFCGQINENFNWDGQCLINTYVNNKLTVVSEAMYLDGEKLSYNMAFRDEKNWYVAERVVNGKYNEGVTYKYSNRELREKGFALDTVVGTDLITVDEFKNGFLDKELQSIYEGRTENGKYEDSTGTAYLLILDENGYVLTLYQGGFAKGKFDDYSGEAWYITRKAKDESDVGYQYYRGVFSKGHAVEKEREIDLTKERIKEIIGEKEFGYQLKWYSKNII